MSFDHTCPVKFLDNGGTAFDVNLSGLGFRLITDSEKFVTMKSDREIDSLTARIYNRLPKN